MYLSNRIKSFRIGENRYFLSNGITGEIRLISDRSLEVLRALESGESCGADPRVIEDLKKRLFVFDSREEEDALFRGVVQLAWQRYREMTPIDFSFVINTLCNFNCVYCFEPERLRSRAQSLSPTQIERAFAAMERLIDLTESVLTPEITVYGGEPLLPSSRPILETLLQHIEDRGYRARILTNGYFINHHLDLIERYKKSIKFLSVTLDGTKQEHDKRRALRGGKGTYDKLVANIQQFLDTGSDVELHLRCSFDQNNLDCIEEAKQDFDDYGWTRDDRVTFFAIPVQDHCPVNDMDSIVAWPDLLERVFDLSKDVGGGPFEIYPFTVVDYTRHYLRSMVKPEHPRPEFHPRATFCGASAQRLFIFHPDGLLYPCAELPGQREWAVGRYAPSLALDAERIAPWSKPRILNQERCFHCDVASFCGGGCPMGALAKNGDVETPFCDHAPKTLERYYELIDRSYREHRAAAVS